ncbi:MAG: AAC(3) family N-acetyltransferase [Victivallaceae bacterium]|nr:AAC(3) family N-acetyltransferase [Victivallaceae bacterium]
MDDPGVFIASFRALCFAALQLRDASETEKALRARRLAARRDWEIERLKNTAASAREIRDLAAEISGICAAALQILSHRAPEKFRRDPASEIIRFFPDAAEKCGIDEKTAALFDGKRPLDRIARIVWAAEDFGPDEKEGRFGEIAARLGVAAHRALELGAAEKIIRPVFDENALVADLRRGGIVPGDKVMVHASLSAMGNVGGGAATAIAALLDAVGNDGIVAMPALSNVCDIPGEFEYDPGETPVVEWIGVFPRIFRTMPGVVRSRNPSHSVLARGRDAARFVAQSDPYDCFSPDGAWAKLRDEGGKILLVGENSVDSNTFLHACEAWYNSYLERVVVRVKNAGKKVETHYPGGCRGNWYHLGKEAPYFQKLLARGLVHTFSFGEAETVVFEAGPLAEAMKTLFAEDPALMLCEKNCPGCVKLRASIAAYGASPGNLKEF